MIQQPLDGAPALISICTTVKVPKALLESYISARKETFLLMHMSLFFLKNYKIGIGDNGFSLNAFPPTFTGTKPKTFWGKVAISLYHLYSLHFYALPGIGREAFMWRRPGLAVR